MIYVYIYIEDSCEVEEDDIIQPIMTTLDPENLFLSNEMYNEYSLVVPNIRDGEEFLITPDEY